MSDQQYWGTFSIFDHRNSLFRKGLTLFDRVIIPVPTAPVYDEEQMKEVISQSEIDQLSADTNYLVSEGAAERVDWARGDFFALRETITAQNALLGAALAKILVKDPPFVTRLILANEYEQRVNQLLPAGGESVTVIPVYASSQNYEEAVGEYSAAEIDTLRIIFNQLSVPSDDAPLEDIIRLRDQPQFRDALHHLRRWQTDTISDLLSDAAGRNEKLKERYLRTATDDLARWVRQYEEAIDNAGVKKIKTGAVSVLGIGTTLAPGLGPLLAALGGLLSPLIDLEELRQPSWKDIHERDCSPAGVIYMAERLH